MFVTAPANEGPSMMDDELLPEIRRAGGRGESSDT